ncbi:hypothetical protein ACFLRF_03920 [Candidatus Altiarchaeota archaeon]
MEGSTQESGGWWKREYWNLLPVAIVILLVAVYFMSKPVTDVEYHSGIKFVTEMPIEKLRQERYDYIALYNTTATKAELTCKFGLSAISTPDLRGYKVSVEEGDTGVYLGLQEASIKGATQTDILDACHAFMCVREDIDCVSFDSLRWFIRNSDSMSVILDPESGLGGGRAYSELIGALSFIQSKRIDKNLDGQLSQDEIDANEYFIYPFVIENGSCVPQPFHNLVENWSVDNETYDCGNISPAITVKLADVNSITLADGKLSISGDDEALHAGGIIVRDTISPDWIRRVYGFE